MSKCNHNREVLDAYTVGAAGLEDLDRQHLENCDACQRQLLQARRLAGMLAQYATDQAGRADRLLADHRPPPLPAATTGADRRLVPRQWLAAAAGLVIAAFGLYALIGFGPSEPPSNGPATPGSAVRYLAQVEEGARRDAMAAYLSGSQTLFLSLLYGTTDCEEGDIEIVAEKKLARDLLRHKRLLEPALEQPARVDVRPVFDEVELLLLEVAAGADCISHAEFNTWKQTLQDRRTLHRMQLLQMKGRI